MSPRKFDRYMVGLGAGRHVKLRRLTVPERYAFFLGVLSLAAQSPVRGCLMVGNLRAEPADVAGEADVSEKVAASAMDKLRAVGMLEDDGRYEWVHDFDDWNPEPKDPTGADRQKRYRQRHRNGDVTGGVTGGRNGSVTSPSRAEVKGREEEELLAASPPSARAREAAFDSRAETVACPRCAAAAGEQCDGARGKRDSCHLERHHAVGELTHISGKAKPTRGFSAPTSLAWVPSPEDVAMRDEHFPDWEVEAVANSAATLRLGRKPVTVEAVRGLLTGEEAA